MKKSGETKDKQKTSYVENLIQTMPLIASRCKCKIIKRKKKL